jgi:hypothetical protein
MLPRAITRDVALRLVVIATVATLSTAASSSSARAEENEKVNASRSVADQIEAAKVIEQVDRLELGVIETAAATTTTGYFGPATPGLGQSLDQGHSDQEGQKPKVISSTREGPRTGGYFAGERTRALSRVVKTNFPRR